MFRNVMLHPYTLPIFFMESTAKGIEINIFV